MSARKPDPAITAWDRFRAAERAHSRAYDERDAAERKARVAGIVSLRPIVRIAGNDCVTMSDAKRSARRLPKAEAAKAIQAMRDALKAWEKRRREAGLAPYDAAERRAHREWQAAMKAMGKTRTTTAAGVILKLNLIAVELRDGPTGFGERILANAIADLSRLRQLPTTVRKPQSSG